MATLALSLAGQVVGGLVGGPIGATVGRALGALAGAVVDDALFGEKPQAAAPVEFRLQGSSEGPPIPRVYGWSRLSGNIIWATALEEIAPEGAGAKGLFGGGEDDEEPVIAASFALALCEGEVHRLGRIWADGHLIETEGLTLRFHRGTPDQGVDSLIEAKQGAGNAPAYRGLCYLVFERLPLGPFGNRIPNFSVEVCRVAGELEPGIRAITVIPGATEFGYDPEPRVRIVSPGVTASENAHMSSAVSDWSLSIDELTALCPGLTHVALVVAWFGDDLRCGACTIRPKVEDATRQIEGTEWAVAGLSRATAGVISTYDGGPAYGGTPSDAAVLAAIADLKARGLSVTLYPIVLMDIAHGNALGQPAYPWRGRITCDPAPGAGGSPDQSNDVNAQVAAFVGTSGDWGFRRLALHYAQLAGSAGGVDAILIGSEMRGMSFLRDAGNGFPFVDALVEIAGEVRAIVGGTTKITYAADWSEFSGLQPADAPGDKFFHLDPLWASDDIDAIGIDNYMPLSDWRDGSDHADAAQADGPYDAGYLRARIAGGEGFDWYYADNADRIAGNRTPIVDGAHGEPWVWRFKDIVGWWSNAHHNRIDGVRSATPTVWAARSKPVWLTELGCGAVDKGANQPNVFGDPKSSEDAAPHFSSGAPDPLMQRQFLRAQLAYWTPGSEDFVDANNPLAPGGWRMLDPERLYLWTWDARPYPAFPADVETWADGPNHVTGHWLTGRLGAVASDELAHAVAADWGVALVDAAPAPPLVHGLVVEGQVSLRDALAPALAATGLTVRETEGGIAIGRANERRAGALDAEILVRQSSALTARRRPDPSAVVGQVALGYADRERGYLHGTATATRLGGGVATSENTSLTLDLAGARIAAEGALRDRSARGETLELTLPPSRASLEAGDVIAVSGQGDGPFEITEIRDGTARRVSARALVPAVPIGVRADRPGPLTNWAVPRAIPGVVFAHLPGTVAAPDRSRLIAAVHAAPWPGMVRIADEVSGTTLARIARPGHAGRLVASLGGGPVHYWDDRNEIEVTLYTGHLASADQNLVLAGANRIAVETGSGWEVIGFSEAELTAPATYRLRRLLRGQAGTGHASGAASVGAAVIVLDERIAEAPVPPYWLGESLTLRAHAGASDLAGTPHTVAIDAGPALPLPPAHARAMRDGGTGDITFAWTRRSRAGGDGWGLAEPALDHVPEAYLVTILDGGLPVRTITAAIATATYPAAEQATDFGAPPVSFAFEVAQLSASLGPGHPAAGTFND